MQPLRHQRTHFEPCVGRPLRTLFGGFAALLDARSDQTSRPKLGAFVIGLRTPHCSLLFLLGLHWSLSFSLCQVAFNDSVCLSIFTFRALSHFAVISRK